MDDKVSVIVPTFNRAAFLGECLASLLRQTLPAHEVLVVDDGCTDHSAEVLAAFGQRITVLRTAGQLGKPAAINLALGRISGDFVWVFDDDDVAYGDALARYVGAFAQDPGAGFSYASFDFASSRPDGSIGPPAGSSPIPDVSSRGFLAPLLESNFLGGAAFFVRTACQHEAGPYDESLIRSQDYEMAARIARRRCGVRVPGPSTFLYRQHGELRGALRDRFSASERNRKWLEYDRRFLQALRRGMALDEYLRPADGSAVPARTQLLQRAVIMACKCLYEEMLEDLRQVVGLDAAVAPSELERALLMRLVLVEPWYGTGGVLEHPGALRSVAAILAAHPAWQAALRRGLAGAAAAALRERSRVQPRLRRLWKAYAGTRAVA